MMNIRAYVRSEHHGHLIDWLHIRGMHFELADEVPEIGFLVYQDDTPIAAGFLRRLENSRVALVDSWITNPNEAPSLRNQALQLLYKRLIQSARALGLRGLLAYTTDDHTLTRAQRGGFEKLPQTVIALDLEKNA